jgi:hypothetical protein
VLLSRDLQLQKLARCDVLVGAVFCCDQDQVWCNTCPEYTSGICTYVCGVCMCVCRVFIVDCCVRLDRSLQSFRNPLTAACCVDTNNRSKYLVDFVVPRTQFGHSCTKPTSTLDLKREHLIADVRLMAGECTYCSTDRL